MGKTVDGESIESVESEIENLEKEETSQWAMTAKHWDDLTAKQNELDSKLTELLNRSQSPVQAPPLEPESESVAAEADAESLTISEATPESPTKAKGKPKKNRKRRLKWGKR